jgi:hypothetical protein
MPLCISDFLALLRLNFWAKLWRLSRTLRLIVPGQSFGDYLVPARWIVSWQARRGTSKNTLLSSFGGIKIQPQILRCHLVGIAGSPFIQCFVPKGSYPHQHVPTDSPTETERREGQLAPIDSFSPLSIFCRSQKMWPRFARSVASKGGNLFLDTKKKKKKKKLLLNSQYPTSGGWPRVISS